MRHQRRFSRGLQPGNVDTFYHAVAFEEETTLVTADACYYSKALMLGNIMLLGDFSRNSSGALNGLGHGERTPGWAARVRCRDLNRAAKKPRL